MSSGHPISFLISHHRQSRLKLFFLLTQTFSLSLSSHLLGSPVLPASRRCPNSRVQYSSFQSWRYRLAYRHCVRAVCLGFCDAVLHLQEGFPIIGEKLAPVRKTTRMLGGTRRTVGRRTTKENRTNREVGEPTRKEAPWDDWV